MVMLVFKMWITLLVPPAVLVKMEASAQAICTTLALLLPWSPHLLSFCQWITNGVLAAFANQVLAARHAQ